jgi:hypothetical protein
LRLPTEVRQFRQGLPLLQQLDFTPYLLAPCSTNCLYTGIDSRVPHGIVSV